MKNISFCCFIFFRFTYVAFRLFLPSIACWRFHCCQFLFLFFFYKTHRIVFILLYSVASHNCCHCFTSVNGKICAAFIHSFLIFLLKCVISIWMCIRIYECTYVCVGVLFPITRSLFVCVVIQNVYKWHIVLLYFI